MTYLPIKIKPALDPNLKHVVAVGSAHSARSNESKNLVWFRAEARGSSDKIIEMGVKLRLFIGHSKSSKLKPARTSYVRRNGPKLMLRTFALIPCPKNEMQEVGVNLYGY